MRYQFLLSAGLAWNDGISEVRAFHNKEKPCSAALQILDSMSGTDVYVCSPLLFPAPLGPLAPPKTVTCTCRRRVGKEIMRALTCSEINL